MNYKREGVNVFKKMWISALVCLLVVSCKAQVTVEPITPTIAPAPTKTPRPTAAPCCKTREDFQPICDIVPGQSTEEDVLQVLGEPGRIIRAADDPYPPFSTIPIVKAETLWQYPHSCPLNIFFDGGHVVAVDSPFMRQRRLGGLVVLYGPPDKIQAIPYLKTEEDLESAYWAVLFFWPAEGIVSTGSLLDLHPLDPTLLSQDALPPFPSYVPVLEYTYYQPTDSMGITDLFYEEGPFASWPGME